MPGVTVPPALFLGGEWMKAFITMFGNISKWLNYFAGIILFLMMMLTVVDVVMRALGRPLVGTYELVSIMGALVVGFAMCQTVWNKGHVMVDFMLEHRSQAVRNGILVCTRVVGICTLALLSLYLVFKANHLHEANEVSLTLRIPMYPAAYALAFCFFIACFVLVADIFKLYVRENGHE